MNPKLYTCLILGMLSLATVNAIAAPLLEDNFDSYSSGTTPVPPWSENYRGWGGTPEYTRAEAAALGVTIQVDDTVAISDKSLHFLDTTGSVGSTITQGFSAASSIVVEYYMRTGNSGYEGTFVTLQGDAGTDYSVTFSNGVYGGQASWIGVHCSPAGWVKPDLLEYSEDTWYYVRRELDCVSDTGLFYVEEVGNPSNNASYSIGRNHSNTYLNSVMMYTSCSQGADCYIDGLNITPEPATLGLLAVGGLALLRRKMK